MFCKQNRAGIHFGCLQGFLLPFLQQRLVVYPLHSESNVLQKIISSANISQVLKLLFPNSFSLIYYMWVGISKTSDLFWPPKELCGLHFSVTLKADGQHISDSKIQSGVGSALGDETGSDLVPLCSVSFPRLCLYHFKP